MKNPDLEQTGENSCAIGSIAGTISFGYLFNCGVEGGTVAGNDNVGGLVGQTLHNTARIYACYNAGTAVFGDMLAGGVLGGGTAASPELGEVESCFNTGTVTGTDTFGSVFGECGTYGACVYLDTSCPDGYNYGISCTAEQFRNGYAASTLSFDGYQRWQYNWTQDLDQENGGVNAEPYPTFNSRPISGRAYGVYKEADTRPFELRYIAYNTDKMQTTVIDGETYYVIKDIYDFVAFINKTNSADHGTGEDEFDANAYVEPGTVLDFSIFGTMSRGEFTNGSTTYMTVADAWNGREEYFYNGTFLGNGVTVKGLSFYYDWKQGLASPYSLFGYIGEEGYVSGINVEEPDIYNENAASGAGIARVNYGTIEDCHINGGEITMLSSSPSVITTAAGITAENYGTIRGCSNSADITGGTFAAGIAGTSVVLTLVYDDDSKQWVENTNPASTAEDPTVISGCSNSGSVTVNGSQGDAGGIYGSYVLYSMVYEPPYVTIENCFNTGEVSAPGMNGGIAGDLAGDEYGKINNCYNSGTIGSSQAAQAAGISASYGVVTNSHNAGSVTVSDSGYAQPIVGTDRTTPAVSTNSYALENCVTGYTGTLYYGPSEELKEQGKVTAGRMASGEIAYLLNALQDTENQVWGQNIGTDNWPVFRTDENNNMVHRVIFTEDETIIAAVYVTHGTAIEDIPEVLERQGYNAAWSVTDFSSITQDMEITPVYSKTQLTADMFKAIAAVEYDGGEQEPQVVPTDSSGLDTDDFSVVYRNNVNAGTASVVVTADEDSTFTGEITLNFTINPKMLTIGETSAEDKRYDGSTDADVSVVLNGIVGKELQLNRDYSVTGVFDDAEPGPDKTVTVMVILKDSENAGNYRIASDTSKTTASISRAVPAAESAPEVTLFYGQTMEEGVFEEGTIVGIDEAALDGRYEWRNSEGELVPDQSGNAQIYFIPEDSVHYEEIPVEVNVTVNAAEPVLTLDEIPSSAEAGTEVAVNANIKNLYNDSISEGLPELSYTYRIGRGEEPPFTGSFIIPENAAAGTEITVTVSSEAVEGRYLSVSQTAVLTVRELQGKSLTRMMTDLVLIPASPIRRIPTEAAEPVTRIFQIWMTAGKT